MSTIIKFFKVTSLPLVLEPNAFYFVNSGGAASESWITDDSGNAKQIGNTDMIETVVAEIDGGTF